MPSPEASSICTRDLLVLAKPRLGLLVLFATAAGYLMARGTPGTRLAFTLLGTALACAAAAILNQAIEHRSDGLMLRTRCRPLPSGRIAPPAAFILGTALAAAGVLALALGTTLLAAGLAAATLLLYLCVYTPMKRRSVLCLPAGAAAGAMPPVIGWTAAGGLLEAYPCLLFALLLAWQIPHLSAIASLHRSDYTQAGVALAPRPGLSLTACGALIVLTLLPVLHENTPALYLPGALLLNALLLACTLHFVLRPQPAAARRLFLASIAYLPALLALMLLTRR